jgi:Na+-driven multidrug efflux pump
MVNEEQTTLEEPSTPPSLADASQSSVFVLPADDDEDAYRKEPWSVVIRAAPTHMLQISRLSWQQSTAAVVSNCQPLVLYLAIGMYAGDAVLNAVGLGVSVVFICSHSVTMGIIASLDALVAQEYGRDPHSHDMGYFLKVVLVCCAISTMLTSYGMIYHLQPALEFLWSDAVLVSEAMRFISASSFYALFFATAMAFSKFAMNQQLPWIPSASAIASSIVAVPIYFGVMAFAPKSQAIEFAALALGLSYLAQTLIAIVLILRTPQTRQTLGGTTVRLDWKKYVAPVLRVGIPAIVLVGGEAAAFNFLYILSGLLSPAENEAFIIRGSIGNLGLSLVYGVALSTAALLGSAIGANNPRLGRRLAFAGVLLAACVTTFNNIVYYSTYPWLYRFFTSNPATLQAARDLSPGWVVFHTGDMMQFTFIFVFCALGESRLGAAICGTGLWIIAMPLTYLSLVWWKVHVLGFYLTWGTCLIVLDCVYTGVLIKVVSFNKVAHDVKEAALDT